VRRLKILIHGQEVETLAGHLDLNQTFVVNANAAPPPRPAAAQPSGVTLTPAAAAVKLAPSANKP